MMDRPRRFPAIGISSAAFILSLCLAVRAEDASGGKTDAAKAVGLSAIAKSGALGPTVVLDLVKFKDGGEAKYDAYDAQADKALASIDGEAIFRGRGLPDRRGRPPKWDRLTLRKYPSVQGVTKMAMSPIYQKGLPDRMAAVEEQFVHAFSGQRLPPKEGRHPPDPMEKPAPAKPGEVYALVLLQFTSDATHSSYEGGGDDVAFTFLGGGVAESVYRWYGIGPVLGEETFHRLVLLRYPDRKVPDTIIGGPMLRPWAAGSGIKLHWVELFEAVE